jgi:succinate dehydrogenase / fumarate reductase, flavoprotein subunit
MIDVSKVITHAALNRTESRGGHTRLDHMESDNTVWKYRNSLATFANEDVHVGFMDKPTMPAELVALFDEGEI